MARRKIKEMIMMMMIIMIIIIIIMIITKIIPLISLLFHVPYSTLFYGYDAYVVPTSHIIIIIQGELHEGINE